MVVITMNYIDLYRKAVTNTLHYNGVNLYDPNNKLFIDAIFNAVVKGGYGTPEIMDKKEFGTSSQTYSVVERNNYWHGYKVRKNVINTLENFIAKRELTEKYFNVLMAEYYESDHLFIYCFIKKFGKLELPSSIDVTKMVYQFEKFGKYKAKKHVFTMNYEQHLKIVNALENHENFFDYGIKFTLENVVFEVTLKYKIIEVMNCLTKHSRKNTYVKYVPLVKFPTV